MSDEIFASLMTAFLLLAIVSWVPCLSAVERSMEARSKRLPAQPFPSDTSEPSAIQAAGSDLG